jgi:Glycosyl transferase family 11
VRTKIIVQLGGGIGNQLFQYYAGQLLAQKHNKQLVLDDSSLRWEYANILRDGLGLSQSGLRAAVPEFFSRVRIKNKKVNLIKKVLRKLLILIGVYKEINLYSDVNSTEKLIAFSEKSIKRSIILKGTFNTSIIVEKALKLGAREIKSIEPFGISEDFKKPIVIHVRLTDYVVDDKQKMIPPEYYEKGLSLAVRDFPGSPIWLFSDNPESALDYFPKEFMHKLDFVNDPKKNSDWDELRLMSVGCAYVIPNSTFGFWAAFLSEASLVICPKPWFKGYRTPTENVYFDFPNHWTQLDW